MNFKLLFQIYILCIFLLHALSPFTTLTFDLCFGAVCFVLAMFVERRGGSAIQFRNADYLFAIIYFLGILPLMFLPTSIGIQNIKYAGLFLLVWLVCYWWVREWIFFSQISMMEISRAAALGCVTLALAVCLEVVLANTWGKYISDFIPFSIAAEDFPQANILGTSFLRPRGFSAEAGFTAIAFECLLPLSIIYLKNRKSLILPFLLVVIPGYLFLGSGSSLICLFVAALVYNFGLRQASAAAWILIIIIGIAIALLNFTEIGSYVYDEIIGRKITDLLSGSISDQRDSNGRRENYILGYTILTASPFGIGWGSISQAFNDQVPIYGQYMKNSGLISLYLEIAVASGVAGLIGTLTLVFSKVWKLSRLRKIETDCVLFSLMWVSLHHAAVFEFWFPMIWLALALADSKLITLPISKTSKKIVQRNVPQWSKFDQQRMTLQQLEK